MSQTPPAVLDELQSRLAVAAAKKSMSEVERYDFRRMLHDWADALVADARALAEAERERDQLRIKCRGTLANNLCPDHRDKQAEKACLACEVETLRTRLERSEGALRAILAGGIEYDVIREIAREALNHKENPS